MHAQAALLCSALLCTPHLPHAVGDPGAVMVELLHAAIAHGAMLGTAWTNDLTARKEEVQGIQEARAHTAGKKVRRDTQSGDTEGRRDGAEGHPPSTDEGTTTSSTATTIAYGHCKSRHL